VRRPLEPGQYLSIRYPERLAEAGAVTSVGSRGDSYDNALAETIIGLYTTDLVRRHGPWKGIDNLEYGTTQVSYQEAEEPVSRLINDFGPAVTSPSRARQRAAMPFVTSSVSCGTATISAAASLARTFLVI
jgi:transposase InsO family protein